MPSQQLVQSAYLSLSCQHVIVNSRCKFAPAQCRQADVKNQAPAQYKHRYCLVSPQSLSRKQIKTKLMLCKPLLIVHGRVKGFLRLYYSAKTKCLSCKSGHGTYIHNEIVAINTKF